MTGASQVERITQRRNAAARRLAALARRAALGQHEEDPEKRDQRQPGGDQPGGFEIGGRQLIAGDDPAHCRADDEAKPERGADHSHTAGSPLGGVTSAT